LEINNCSIIQNNLPKYHENKGLNLNIRKLFSICTGKSESKSIFSNNNIYISKFIKDDKYKKQYSTLISYVDKIENSVFDFEEAFEISTLIFIGAKEIKNCKFSGIKIDNYIFENELIKLGPKSEIKKCEFINLHPKAFLIDVATTEASAKIKKVLIEKCIFKDCSSKTRDKNSIIVKSNWGFRMFRKDYTYTVTEVKDCQFI